MSLGGESRLLRQQFETRHAWNCKTLVSRVCRALNITDPLEVDRCCRAAFMHDIGKVRIPDRILLEPGPLSEIDRMIMRLHPEYSRRIVEALPAYADTAEIVYHHHERWDGTGYPDALKGTAIPLLARIVAVVDVYDALISERPYRPAFSTATAWSIVLEGSGTHFDPVVVEALRIALRQGEADVSRPTP